MAVFTITQFLSLFDGVPLDVTHSPLTRSGSDNVLELREGGSAEINLQTILNGLSGFSLDSWSDLDLDNDATVGVTLGYQLAIDTFGTDRLLTSADVEVSSDTSINSGELTVDTTNVEANGIITVSLSQGSIAEHVGDDDLRVRFFVAITINDGYT